MIARHHIVQELARYTGLLRPQGSALPAAGPLRYDLGHLDLRYPVTADVAVHNLGISSVITDASRSITRGRNCSSS
jgi:hypothetical protein